MNGLAVLGDLRFAVKSLARSPGFTLIAIVTLGLGIGANTSMFSILNGYMLRPLPYPDSDRLDRIYRATAQNSRGGVSPADYLDLKSADERLRRDRRLRRSGHEPLRARQAGRDGRRPPHLRQSLLHPRHRDRSSAAASVPTKRSWATTASSSSATATGRIASGATPTSSAAPFASTASPTRSSACCPPPSTTGATWVRSTSSGRSASTRRRARDRSSTWLRLVGRRSGDAHPRAGARPSSPTSAAASPPTSPPPTPTAPGARVPIDDSVSSTKAPGHHRHAGRSLRLRAAHRLLQPGEPPPRPHDGPRPRVRRALRPRRLARPDAAPAVRRVAAAGPRRRRLRDLRRPVDLRLARGRQRRGQRRSASCFALDWRVLGWAFGACLFTALAFGVAPALFALPARPEQHAQERLARHHRRSRPSALPPASSSSASSPSPWSCSRAPPSSCAGSTS